MKLYYEWGIKQLNKYGEELCGDCVAISRLSDSVTLALSDGLGSGVKANILAMLTTRIAIHMLENDLALDEVVQTLSETLPICRVRKLAYSTFAIAQFFSQGSARIVEFDSPTAMLLRRRKIQPLVYEERSIKGKTIRESLFDLEVGDWIIFVSDGVLNAGIGGIYPLGWGWDQSACFLEKHAHQDLSAQDLADRIAKTVSELYENMPGDDVSVVVIKVRRKKVATVLTGPPAEKCKDEALVSKFVRCAGQIVVCGGTTAKIVSRYLGQPLEVDMKTITPDVPAIAHIEGVNLVTEGIITLTQVSGILQSGARKEDVRFRTDGAAELVRLFLDVDHVNFLVGKAVNPAHQNPELPHQLEIRLSVVREIAEELRKRGKEVNIESV